MKVHEILPALYLLLGGKRELHFSEKEAMAQGCSITGFLAEDATGKIYMTLQLSANEPGEYLYELRIHKGDNTTLLLLRAGMIAVDNMPHGRITVDFPQATEIDGIFNPTIPQSLAVAKILVAFCELCQGVRHGELTAGAWFEASTAQ